MPELRDAEILSEVVCIRPGRKQGIRLDATAVDVDVDVDVGVAGSGTTRTHVCTVVTCYGHGGAGMSLAWGCAGEVVEHVGRSLAQLPAAGSKL